MSNSEKPTRDSFSDLSEQERSDSFMGERSGSPRSAGDTENPQDDADVPQSRDARPRGHTEDPDLTL